MKDFATGWVEDSGAVSALLEELPQPFASNTPAGQIEELPEKVHLCFVRLRLSQYGLVCYVSFCRLEKIL